MAGATLRDGKGKFETRARVVKNAGDGGAARDRRLVVSAEGAAFV